VLATVKGLRRGTLLVPEPVAPAAAAPAGEQATPAV
jgi:hypothetical protein